MRPVDHPFGSRFCKGLAFINDLFKKLMAILVPRARKVRSQRMCPFCGLITSGHKTSCLECGKSFSAA